VYGTTVDDNAMQATLGRCDLTFTNLQAMQEAAEELLFK
jgi:hypothetical protein